MQLPRNKQHTRTQHTAHNKPVQGISLSHRVPLYPSAHRHSKPAPPPPSCGTHVASLRHGFGEHATGNNTVHKSTHGTERGCQMHKQTQKIIKQKKQRYAWEEGEEGRGGGQHTLRSGGWNSTI